MKKTMKQLAQWLACKANEIAWNKCCYEGLVHYRYDDQWVGQLGHEDYVYEYEFTWLGSRLLEIRDWIETNILDGGH